MDAYDILGVARGASLEKVKTNFRKLALELHPDKGGSEHLFNVLKKSYVQVLQDIKEKRNNKDFHELKEDHEEFKRTEQQMKHMHIDEEKEDDVMRQFHKVFLKNKVVIEHGWYVPCRMQKCFCPAILQRKCSPEREQERYFLYLFCCAI